MLYVALRDLLLIPLVMTGPLADEQAPVLLGTPTSASIRGYGQDSPQQRGRE
jgi:hypothetical protein